MDYENSSELSVELQILANFISEDEFSGCVELPLSYLRTLYPQFLGVPTLTILLRETGEKAAYKMISDYEPVKAWSRWLQEFQLSEPYLDAKVCISRNSSKVLTYELDSLLTIFKIKVEFSYRQREISSLMSGIVSANEALLLEPKTPEETKARNIVIQPFLSLLRGDLQ